MIIIMKKVIIISLSYNHLLDDLTSIPTDMEDVWRIQMEAKKNNLLFFVFEV